MKINRRPQLIVAGFILFCILFLFYKFNHVLFPFILAIFIAYILSPIVDWMSSRKIKKWNIPRGLSVIVIYFVFFTIVITGGTILSKSLFVEMTKLVKELPTFGKTLTEEWVPTVNQNVEFFMSYLPKAVEPEILQQIPEEKSNKMVESQYTDNELLDVFVNHRIELKAVKEGYIIIPHPINGQTKNAKKSEFDINDMIDNSIQFVVEYIQSIMVNLWTFGQSIITSTVSFLLKTVITLMISAFIVIDSEKILWFLRSLFPNNSKKYFDTFLEKLDTGMNGVVRGQLIICAINGTLTGIGLFFLGVNFSLLLSIIAAICSIIPIFGVVISSVPIIVMALTDSIWTAVLSLIWILIIHFVEGNFLNPKILGKAAEIHPVLVILALVAGQETFGLPGSLLAVPLFSILQTTFLYILEQTYGYKYSTK